MVRTSVAICALAVASLGVAAAEADRDDLVPEDWVPLPRLSAAVPAGGVVKARRAHGDPSRGVYLFVQDVELPEKMKLPALAREVVKTLTAKGFELTPVGSTGADFRLGGTRGGFRLRPRDRGHAQVVTCFYNERDRERSGEECAAVLKRSETSN